MLTDCQYASAAHWIGPLMSSWTVATGLNGASLTAAGAAASAPLEPSAVPAARLAVPESTAPFAGAGVPVSPVSPGEQDASSEKASAAASAERVRECCVMRSPRAAVTRQRVHRPSRPPALVFGLVYA